MKSAQKHFMTADITGDGKLSYAEFQNWFKNHYQKDSDGEKVTPNYPHDVAGNVVDNKDVAVNELRLEVNKLKSQLELKVK